MVSGTSPGNSVSSDSPPFRLRGVTQRYDGKIALEAATLEVRRGEALALVGPSGAGKTTLLKLLNGSIRPTEGIVEVGGQVLTELSARSLRDVRARIGFVHQDLSLVPNLRVSQNVLMGRLGRNSFFSSLRTLLLPPRVDIGRVHEILERVGIPEKLFDRTDTLSGGQQQRVAIARALFQDPEVFLADEPVSAVDPARAEDTVRLLTEISRERSITLVVSLHNLELARRYFPRLVGLRRGRIEFDLEAGAVDDRKFRSLYELGEQEMMDDGA